MGDFKRISTETSRQLITDREAQLVDIRDEQSFRLGHIEGAMHLDNRSIGDFISTADQSRPVIVYCYHGNSSQPAAAYLNEQGFREVYSMDGGFEVWRGQYPETCTP
jgi:thiosulfate sulfurtransferase